MKNLACIFIAVVFIAGCAHTRSADNVMLTKDNVTASAAATQEDIKGKKIFNKDGSYYCIPKCPSEIERLYSDISDDLCVPLRGTIQDTLKGLRDDDDRRRGEDGVEYKYLPKRITDIWQTSDSGENTIVCHIKGADYIGAGFICVTETSFMVDYQHDGGNSTRLRFDGCDENILDEDGQMGRDLTDALQTQQNRHRNS